MATELSQLSGKQNRSIKSKILILGEGGVGKTTMLYRYVNNVFMDSTKMTIGSDFFVKKVQVSTEHHENFLSMLLWDFAGQDRFRFILKDYTRGADAVILAFDLTRFSTLEKLYNWIDILKEGKVFGNPAVKFFLVGTKKDKEKEGIMTVSKGEIADFCTKFNILQFFETSALSGLGIEELFQEVAKTLIVQEDHKQTS